MIYTQIFFVLLAVILPLDSSSLCDPVDFIFLGETWHFPSTIQEAVVEHHLDYIPPGGYFKKDSAGREILLDYHYIGGDFVNEHQPKESLFPREIHSYVFRFKDQKNIYDSLKLVLEQTYNNQFILTKGMKDSDLVLPENKPFAYDLLKVNECLTIGIKHSSSRKKEKLVSVRFMYNLPLGKMGIHMGNF